MSTMAVGLMIMVLVFPIILRVHHYLLLMSWNAIAVVFFLQGKPDLWLVMVALSLGMSVLQMALNRHIRFISAPQIVWPLLCMLVVVVITARLTGGFGLKSMGSSVFGAKRYVYLIGGILGYFAITARRVPEEQARFYLKLYFLGGLTAMIGDFFSFVSPSLYFIYWIFPPNAIRGGVEFGTTRLGGVAVAASAISYSMMVMYGIRGIFETRKIWRLLLFITAIILSMLGGFRSNLILFSMVFTALFFLEGLHRTKLLPILGVCALIGLIILVPLASRLPYTLQRTLSFLPVHIDDAAEQDAEGSLEWRIHMWEALMPQIPKYLLLGKGYSLSPQDFDVASSAISYNTGSFDENMWASITGDYHNGPLSVILTFGIWGAIVFLWFLAASIRLLYYNYRRSPPELQIINAFLFAFFLARTVEFFFVFGSLHSDMAQFVGLVGLSVSLNGGMRKQVVEPVRNPRIKAGLGNVFSRPRPAFQK